MGTDMNGNDIEGITERPVEIMNMDELAAHLIGIAKGSRYRVTKLTLEIRRK